MQLKRWRRSTSEGRPYAADSKPPAGRFARRQAFAPPGSETPCQRRAMTLACQLRLTPANCAGATQQTGPGWRLPRYKSVSRPWLRFRPEKAPSSCRYRPRSLPAHRNPHSCAGPDYPPFLAAFPGAQRPPESISYRIQGNARSWRNFGHYILDKSLAVKVEVVYYATQVQL